MLKKPGSLRSSETLYVITPISNPVRYHSRYRLYKQFEERMLANPNVHLITVEAAFGDRNFEITQAGNSQHVQVRTSSELWHKENLINIGISRLPEDWEYVAWVDGDVEFTHRHWATETLHQLQHHQIVQMFQDAIDMGPTGNTLQVVGGFGYLYNTGAPEIIAGTHNSYYLGQKSQKTGRFWHPGYAWAARREAINAMGGLIDWPILGSADHHMSLAWIGRVDEHVPQGMSPAYHKKLRIFQDHCEKHIRRDIGFVDGTLLHHWHGKKRQRFYDSRWKILLDSGFDPDYHIKRDHQGLWQLIPEATKLRDDLRNYFRMRNEDSIDEE